MPGACVVFSPWIDLELTGESLRTRADVDPSLTVNGLRRAATDYLHGRSPRHSGANALHASLAGLPPMFIQVGSREILFDDSIRLAAHAGTAGVSVELQCWPEMVHVFQAFAAQLPEGRAALQAAGAFIRTKVTLSETSASYRPLLSDRPFSPPASDLRILTISSWVWKMRPSLSGA
ncbi:acetyl-hydrolase [Arthrobacter sp. Hiyo8]|nr:acetyl-hydrolase [Arthrobacter sp. Hiyo8]